MKNDKNSDKHILSVTTWGSELWVERVIESEGVSKIVGE